MAGSGGHGRFSRPENFTMRAASQRLNTLVMVASTAAAGGMAATRKSTSRPALVTPGSRGRSAGVPVSTRRIVHQRVAQAGAEAVGIEAEIGNGDDHDQRAENRRPDHQPAGRIPFERRRAAVADRTRQHREIAKPPGGQSGAGQKREEKDRAEGDGERQRAGHAAISAAQWLQPRPAIMIGSGAR